jgi:hypothetical protein
MTAFHALGKDINLAKNILFSKKYHRGVAKIPLLIALGMKAASKSCESFVIILFLKKAPESLRKA